MNAKHNQSEQDYLESILTLSKTQAIVHRIDVAKRMGVSQAAVNKAMKLLVEKEYIYEDGKHLYLTQKGKEYAEEDSPQPRGRSTGTPVRTRLASSGVGGSVPAAGAGTYRHSQVVFCQ